jgi:outer membrane murein-binding lipoprotein Lpp
MFSKSNSHHKSNSKNTLIYSLILLLSLLTVYMLITGSGVLKSSINTQRINKVNKDVLDTMQELNVDMAQLLQLREKAREIKRFKNEQIKDSNRRLENLEKMSNMLLSEIDTYA